jgi:prepilin-type N-terminal cleavage/methylation domain-containing protein
MFDLSKGTYIMKRFSQSKQDKGFTLTELLVIIAIIALLSAIAVPIYLNQQKSSRQTVVKADVSNVILSLEDEKLDGLYGTAIPTGTKLSDGVTVRVVTSTDRKSTCVQGYHKGTSAKVWSISSSSKKVVEGACS